MIRVGQGYDIHQLVENRPLIIGGVDIPHYKGLLGHSDADILIHALVDALLGAAALGDIGTLYPDNDIKFKNMNSRIFLKDTYNKITELGFRINNIDATIIIEKPKLKDYIKLIKINLASDLNLSMSQINIKAKTNEKFDSIGQENTAVAQVVVLISS
jgi:2-C-methyl-D-erythritol 2,4-cyclodiphosphate synthase